jgi:hypothetical protein
MLIGVFFGIILGKHYGIYGVILPIVLASFINTIINNILYVSVFDFKIVRFYKNTFLFQTIYASIIVMLFLLFKNCFLIDNWFKFILSGIVFSGFYLLFYYILLFNKEEKLLLWRR